MCSNSTFESAAAQINASQPKPAPSSAPSMASPPAALPSLAAPPPVQKGKDPLIGRSQNLGSAKIASLDLKNGTKQLLGG